MILLEKLCTEKEKRRHRFLAKNKVGTCGISERRFIQGNRPEAGAELAMTGRAAALTHLFLGIALVGRVHAMHASRQPPNPVGDLMHSHICSGAGEILLALFATLPG